MIIKVDDNISLELLQDKHADETFALIKSNTIYLREWLPWVDNMKTVADFKYYIAKSLQLHGEGIDLGFVILFDNVIAGRIGIHHINRLNKFGAIGYWLGEQFTGKGIIIKSCRALIDYGFTTVGLNRIELKCGTGNYKSKAVAEKLHFTKEGILRQAEWVYDKFIDLYVFSMLKQEWNKTD